MNQEGFSKNTSRREMLRDSAMAATGAVLLPSFFDGCTNDVQEIIKGHFPKKGLGGLFMDDTPTHIINPVGLFNRSYVSQQFSIKKPDFGDTTELAYTANEDYGAEGRNFTGGLFPQLTTK